MKNHRRYRVKLWSEGDYSIFDYAGTPATPRLVSMTLPDATNVARMLNFEHNQAMDTIATLEESNARLRRKTRDLERGLSSL